MRPGWGGGKLNATSLLLEPLGPDECAELMERSARTRTSTTTLRDRITTASAGNPLYVEEMLAMVREHGGDGEIAVPPTIHALLQARIDSLDGDVRVVMERGSVEGEVFHRGAVAELSPDPAADRRSSRISQRSSARSSSAPHPPTFPEDEGFRFRHLLIRDAAYESLPKATRAELHERFADWLATHDLVEGDEIVGYHLEQAHRYRRELDRRGPLAARRSAAARRADSALRAAAPWTAGTAAPARGLLRRATRTLVPEGSDARATLAPELALALREAGDSEEALQRPSEAARGGRSGRARSRV